MKRSIGRYAAVGLAALSAVTTLVAGVGAGSARAAGTAPPYEPTSQAVGQINLLDAQGMAVSSGSTTATPFATYAVGTAAPRTGDKVAALFACLPQEKVDPSRWSCDQLSSYTTYPVTGGPASVSSASGPVATVTSQDLTLAQFAKEYPNTSTADGYAGLYQLRLRTAQGGSSNSTPTVTYDDADISVDTTGNTFQVVYPAQAPTTVTAAVAGDYAPLTPARVLDTRVGTGAPKSRPGANSTTTIQVTGAGGVPATGVAAVVLTVTAVVPSSVGNLRVYPAGGSVPLISNVNYTKGATVANAVVVPVSSSGQVSIFTVASADLVADVSGYFLGAPGAANSTAGSLTGVGPARILDTRDGTGAAKGTVAANTALPVQVTGKGGVPSTGVSAVVLNVTAVTPGGVGNLRVYPAGASVPTVSNVNYVAGQTVANLVTVPVSSTGMVDVYTVAKSDLVADVAGYFSAGDGKQPSTSGAFVPVTPNRVLDTRSGVGAPTAQVPAGSSLPVQLAGRGGLPLSEVGAVVANVTEVLPASVGFLTVYPDGVTKPFVSNLNYLKGQTVAGGVFATVPANGKTELYTVAKADLVADVSGYFLGAPNA